MLAAGIGEDLRVHEAGIQPRVNACDVLADARLQPALRLCAIERVAGIGGQRVAVGF